MRARNLAWAVWVVTVSLVAGALVLGLANRPVAPLVEVPLHIIPPTFATLGALISSRRPRNVMGWIFLATGVLSGVQISSGQYATIALASDGPARGRTRGSARHAGPELVPRLYPFPRAAVPRREAALASLAPAGLGYGVVPGGHPGRRRVEPGPVP
jgi:hypothetical protein